MNIDKEYIVPRLENLKKQYDKHIADANAVLGAIQVYEQELADLEVQEDAKPSLELVSSNS